MQPKHQKCLLACLVAALAVIASPFPTLADEKAQEDAYTSVWESLSDLLRRREYGTAAALLDTLADDPKLRGDGAQIEADKAVIDGLLGLEQIVREQAAKLPVGSRLDIYGTEYSVVKYEKNAKGDELVLRSQASGREYRKPVASLPSSTWMQLAEGHLSDMIPPALILGIFAGFDKSSDTETARKLMNKAASEGANVTRWLARLEDAVNNKKPAPVAAKAKPASDPITGLWRVRVGKGLFDMEIRANGTIVCFAPNPGYGKWVKDEDGTYRVTFVNGATAKVALISDQHVIGKNAAGDTVSAMRKTTK